MQDAFRQIGFFEDFGGYASTTSVANATAGTQYNDITVVALSGATSLFFAVDESGGVVSANGAGAAADGMAFIGPPMIPSSNGTIRMGARFKGASATDLRVFCGFQETINWAETVNPFTLSGTSLTSNDGGNVVGFYTDTSANTDDYRFHSSLDGTESTSAALSDAISGATTLGALGIRAVATVTAGSWVTVRVEIDVAGNAEGWLGAIGMADQNGLTRVARMKSGTLDEDALYKPLLILAAGSSGDPLLLCDYFWAEGNRDWSY